MTKRTMERTAVATAMAVTMWLGAAPGAGAATMESKDAFTKLTRGIVNVLTGWVEIPKRLLETSEDSGPAAGFTWGLIRGTGYGFIRTAAGFYEILTFPYPAPPNYAPIVTPEYVFTNESAPIETYDY